MALWERKDFDAVLEKHKDKPQDAYDILYAEMFRAQAGESHHMQLSEALTEDNKVHISVAAEATRLAGEKAAAEASLQRELEQAAEAQKKLVAAHKEALAKAEERLVEANAQAQVKADEQAKAHADALSKANEATATVLDQAKEEAATALAQAKAAHEAEKARADAAEKLAAELEAKLPESVLAAEAAKAKAEEEAIAAELAAMQEKLAAKQKDRAAAEAKVSAVAPSP